MYIAFILPTDIHKLTNAIWDKELPQKWKEFVIEPSYKRVIKLSIVIIEEYYSYQLYTKFYLVFFSLCYLYT